MKNGEKIGERCEMKCTAREHHARCLSKPRATDELISARYENRRELANLRYLLDRAKHPLCRSVMFKFSASSWISRPAFFAKVYSLLDLVPTVSDRHIAAGVSQLLPHDRRSYVAVI